MNIPLFERDDFEGELAQLSESEREIASSLRQSGYAIIDFPEPEFDTLARTIIDDLEPVLRQGGSEGASSGRPVRIQDHDLDAVRRLAGNERVIEILSKVYGRSAFPFQTLNFSLGTQQPVHSDDVHFSSYPKGFMCGVWVALEDIHPDAGPLEFYPESHRLQNIDGITIGQHPFENPNAQPAEFGQGTQLPLQDLWNNALTVSDTEAEHFLAKRGQALIWVYNLLHGGSHQANMNRTRWSQVTHYYFEDCDYYTPVSSKYRDGKVAYRDTVADLRNDTLKSSPPKAILPVDFDPEVYLELNPDVKVAGADPAKHWIDHGFFESRRYK